MRGGSPGGADRRAPPAPGAIRRFDFPDVVSTSLDNGLDLRVARLPRLPVVTMAVVLPAGEAALDAGDAGLAVLAGDALEGGTARRSGAELAEALEGVGAGLSVATGWDSTTVSLSCHADRLEEAAALLAEVVVEPAFPEDEVERARAQRIARIRQRAMDPGSLASDEAVRRIYAEGVAYGRPLAGTEDSVAGLDRERVARFARDHYAPGGGGLVVVGDVAPDEIGALARETFGRWVGAPPVRRAGEMPPRTREREVHVVHRPGAVQSELRVGHVGVARDTPDHFPLVVANTVLGGAFTSRLNLNLREARGYTYGVRSRFAFRRAAGPFSVSTAVGTDVTADAVAEIVSELDALVTGGLADDEVEAARDYVAGVFPLRLETTGQVAARIAELIVYGLADDWYARYRDRVRAVDRPAAEAAARRTVRPTEAQVVVVGDADAVTESLEGLGLGPVTVRGGR